MTLSMIVTTQRQMAVDIFNRFHTQAWRDWAVAALFARKNPLKDFADILPRLQPNRAFAGQQDIPIEQITGSVGRSADFDAAFRPLKANLRDRWVAMYLSLQTDGWPPILVYKVCGEYFVEDGHHRVSVARNTGMAFIRAEVWEYSLKPAPLPAPAPKRAIRAVAPAQASCSCGAASSGQLS